MTDITLSRIASTQRFLLSFEYFLLLLCCPVCLVTPELALVLSAEQTLAPHPRDADKSYLCEYRAGKEGNVKVHR